MQELINELSKGSLIEFDCYVCRVISVDRYNNIIIEDMGGNEFETQIEACYPLILNKEWLDNLGFWKSKNPSKNVYVHPNFLNIEIEVFDNDTAKMCIVFGSESVFEYDNIAVHQLQMICYALTLCELKYEN